MIHRIFGVLFLGAVASFGDFLIVRNQGNTIIPQHESELSMDAETVRISLDEERYEYLVHCEFTLTSHSDEDVVRTVAFPITDEQSDRYMFEHFKVSVSSDGKMVDLETCLKRAAPSNSLPYPSYIVWQQEFRAHETQVASCEYYMGHFGGSSSRPMCTGEFKYVVRTGALWNGKIKDASFEIDLWDPIPDGYKIIMSYPEHATWVGDDKRKLVWEFTDWEPTEDMMLGCAEWTGYETNDIIMNHYLLPEPYLGASKLYTQDYLDQLVQIETNRVARYFPERELDVEFIRSMIAEHLYYELFARRGDAFFLTPDSEKKWRKCVVNHKSFREEDFFSDWREYFMGYAYHDGWYCWRRKQPVRLLDLSEVEHQNAQFLKQFISRELIR